MVTLLIKKGIDMNIITRTKSILRLTTLALTIAPITLSSAALASPFILSIGAGDAISRLSNNTIVTPVTGLQKTYNAKVTTNNMLMTTAGIGYNFGPIKHSPFMLRVDLNYFYTNLGRLSGTEIPGSNLGFTDTLDYSLKAHTQGLMLTPKIIYTHYKIQPYLQLGLGYAWNSLQDFSETEVPGSAALPANPYANNTIEHFAYSFGLGVHIPMDKWINAHFSADLGYEYLNVGVGKLGKAVGQDTADRFTTRPIGINIALASLAYQF